MPSEDSWFHVEIPQISEPVAGDDELSASRILGIGSGDIGWYIRTASGKRVKFCVDGNFRCCERISIEKGYSYDRRTVTELFEEFSEDGPDYVYRLCLAFPGGKLFKIQNVHNGFYPHKVSLEIDGEPYDCRVPLMV